MDNDNCDNLTKVRAFLDFIQAKKRRAEDFAADHDNSTKKVAALENKTKDWEQKVAKTNKELKALQTKLKRLEARSKDYNKQLQEDRRELMEHRKKLEKLNNIPTAELGIDDLSDKALVSDIITASCNLTAHYNQSMTCYICSENKTGADMVRNNKCVHTACKQCMTQILYTKQQAQDRCGYCRSVCTRFFTLVKRDGGVGLQDHETSYDFVKGRKVPPIPVEDIEYEAVMAIVDDFDTDPIPTLVTDDSEEDD